MSIIYGTLQRLEEDAPPGIDKLSRANLLPLPVRSGGFAVKILALVVTLVLTALILALWLPLQNVGILPIPQSTGAVTQSTAEQKPGYKEPSAIVLAQPISETTMKRGAYSAVTISAVKITEKNSLRSDPGQAPQPAAVEKSEAVAKVKTSATRTQVVEPREELVEPVEQQQAQSSHNVMPDVSEEAIEQARYALSRGQYLQALSTLDSLEPVPDNRPDFWLIKGSAHLGIGQLDLAELAFSSAQVLLPDNAQITVQQAILKQEKGDHISALQILKSAAIRHPTVPEIFLNQGYSQQTLGAGLDAKRSFRAFLKMTEGRSLYLQQREIVKKWLAQATG